MTTLSFESVVVNTTDTKAAVKRACMLARTDHFAADSEEFFERSKNLRALFSAAVDIDSSKKRKSFPHEIINFMSH